MVRGLVRGPCPRRVRDEMFRLRHYSKITAVFLFVLHVYTIGRPFGRRVLGYGRPRRDPRRRRRRALDNVDSRKPLLTRRTPSPTQWPNRSRYANADAMLPDGDACPAIHVPRCRPGCRTHRPAVRAPADTPYTTRLSSLITALAAARRPGSMAESCLQNCLSHCAACASRLRRPSHRPRRRGRSAQRPA